MHAVTFSAIQARAVTPSRHMAAGFELSGGLNVALATHLKHATGIRFSDEVAHMSLGFIRFRWIATVTSVATN